MIQLKSPSEIEGIKKSGQILKSLFEELEGFIRPGISTKSIDVFCADFLHSKGAKPACLHYRGFPANACVSVNHEIIHGIPNSKKIIIEGDLVKVDLDADLDGFISDSAHTFEVGTVKPSVHKLNIETRTSLYKGIEAASAKGARVSDISRAVYDYVKKFGYGVVRDYCGHGVGFELHEDPLVPNYVSPEANARLKEGLVFTIEPMITMGTWKCHTLQDKWTVVSDDKSIAAHWEHTVAITSNGLEILT